METDASAYAGASFFVLAPPPSMRYGMVNRGSRMRSQHGKWVFDHTEHWRGRRPKQFSRITRRGVPGHYAPRGHYDLPDALWLNRIDKMRKLYGRRPVIGGGRPYLFLLMPYSPTRYRVIDPRGGFIGGWTTQQPER